MIRPRRAIRVAVPIVALAFLAPVTGASAQRSPALTLDRSTVSPGDPVIVTLEHFTGSAVTIAVCGNLAKRGSADCNMSSSAKHSIERGNGKTLVQLFVHSPPSPCPCVIRALSTSTEDFALAPLVLTRHPVGPVIESHAVPLVDVKLVAEATGSGLARLKSWLGGETRFEIRVAVKNRTSDVLTNLHVTGAARRGGADVAALDLPPIGTLGAGEQWEGVAIATVPAPAVGAYSFDVTASGVGRPVTGSVENRMSPTGLLVVGSVFVIDLLAILWRVRRKALSRGNAVIRPSGVRPLEGARAA